MMLERIETAVAIVFAVAAILATAAIIVAGAYIVGGLNGVTWLFVILLTFVAASIEVHKLL